MRKQYHFRPSNNGFYAWDVDRLIVLVESIHIENISLSYISELNETFWFNHGYSPTCKAVAEHARLIYEVDLSYPIILCPAGKVMDGMHRVCKAYLTGTHRFKQNSFLKCQDTIILIFSRMSWNILSFLG